MRAALPPDESARIAALRAYNVLNTPPERAFDEITELARLIADCPIALVSLIDVDRQWLKSRVGFDAPATTRDVAFCAHAILTQDVCIVPDATADDRFSDNPLVTGSEHIRFYTGVPLVTPSGHAIGTLCVLDRRTRQLDAQQLAALRVRARQVVTLLQLRRAVAERNAMSDALSMSEARYRGLVESGQGLICTHDPNGVLLSVNSSGAAALGYNPDEMIGRSLVEFMPDEARAGMSDSLPHTDGCGAR